MTLARIHQYLSMAMSMLFIRQQDSFGALGLALNATNERNGHEPELAQIHELLVAARDLWRTLPGGRGRRPTRASSRARRRASSTSPTSWR